MEEKIINQLTVMSQSLEFHGAKLEELRSETDAFKNEMKTRLNEMEYHQRKYNLLFFGLKFAPNNCEEAVREFIAKDLEIGKEPAGAMFFQHCHPLSDSLGKSACIVRFVCFRDRDKVLKSLGKLKGKNSKVTVRTDLPKDFRNTRKQLLGELAEFRKKDPGRILRLSERGMVIRIEEKKNGQQSKV